LKFPHRRTGGKLSERRRGKEGGREVGREEELWRNLPKLPHRYQRHHQQQQIQPREQQQQLSDSSSIPSLAILFRINWDDVPPSGKMHEVPAACGWKRKWSGVEWKAGGK